MSRDNTFWKKQINEALSENKDYFNLSKKVQEEYVKTKGSSYNILYSNTQVLQANLLANNPKPDIQRRFLKKTESDKLKYNTYLEVAKITEGATSYFADTSKLEEITKTQTTHNSLLVGRGISWVEYEPTIETNELGEEEVVDKTIKLHSLNYNEYLESKADKESLVWWRARKHCLTVSDLKEQFDFEFQEDDLDEKEQSQKTFDVWEIWEKPSKSRIFVLMSSKSNEFLRQTKDPYGLENFFPCSKLGWLTKVDCLTPIPEYEIYREKAKLLNSMSSKADELEKAIKFLLVADSSNKDKASEVASSSEGDLLTLNQTNPTGNGQIPNLIGTIPVEGAISLAVHREEKKQLLKQDIYDITGISDIARGQTNAQETATAQKIKGVFGSLRFQDRQKKVQAHIREIYSIFAELICEHFDEETLSAITCTYLPTEEEKQSIKLRLAQQQVIANNPQAQQYVQIQPVTQEEIDILEQPTWNDVLGIMQDDKLRNYTIDIESDATVFDDKVQQNADIQALSKAYQEVIATAYQFRDANIIKGFMPIAKMILTNIKSGRALHQQLLEALEQGVRDLEAPQEPNQADQIGLQKAQLDMQKTQAEIQDRQARTQLEAQKEANRGQELQLKTMEMQEKLRLEQQKAMQQSRVDIANIQDDNRNTDIKQQDADRKDRELEVETQIAVAEIVTGQDAPIVAGDVGSVR